MVPRMHVVNAIFKRNFRSYFSSVLGYLFIVAFVGLGSYGAFTPQFFGNNLCNLDQLNQWFPVLLMFIIPAITMSIWADERKLGTDELLFTLPVSDMEALLGKYLAVLGVYTVALMFSVSHIIVLVMLGNPDPGLVFTTYFGYWISGAALLSCGMFASILTSSPTVAYVVGSLFCAIPVFIDKLAPYHRLFQGLSVPEQFRDFGMGMIPIGGLWYFASLAALLLYLNMVFISRRHWAGGPYRGPMWVHYLVRAVSLAAVLISANLIISQRAIRLDWTSEKLYSINSATRGVFNDIPADRTVVVHAFVSPEVPRELVAVRSSLVGTLRQLERLGGNKLQVRIVNTEQFSANADEARNYKIEPQQVQSERLGRYTLDEVFLGAFVTAGGNDEVTIPFFDVGTPIEYELAKAIQTVTKKKRRKVGVLETDAKVMGGMNMATFSRMPEWHLISELKKHYELVEVKADKLSLDEVKDLDVLIAIAPSSLTDPEMEQLVNYIHTGKPVFIADDPFPIIHQSIIPSSPKPNPGGGMFGNMGGGGPPKADGGKAGPLCRAIGIAWDYKETVWDRAHDPHPDISALLAQVNCLYVNEQNGSFNPTNIITQGLQEIMMVYPGNIRKDPETEYQWEPLIRTSALAQLGDLEKVTRRVMQGYAPLPDVVLPKPKNESYVLAVRITSPKEADSSDKKADSDKDAKKKSSRTSRKKSKTAPPVNVVYVADIDWFADFFFHNREHPNEQLKSLQKLDNTTFVLNALDDLMGDASFVELRTRRPKHRTLEEVEQRTADFRNKRSEEIREAEKQADETLKTAQTRLSEAVEKIRNKKDLDDRTKAAQMQAAQEDERRRMEVEREKVLKEKSQKIQAMKAATEREIRSIENGIRLKAILIPPIPAMILGILVFAFRVNAEKQGIAPERLLTRQN